MTLPSEREFNASIVRLRRSIAHLRTQVHMAELEDRFGSEIGDLMQRHRRIVAQLDVMRTLSGREAIEMKRNLHISLDRLEEKVNELEAALEAAAEAGSAEDVMVNLRRLWR